ncbi:MAG TPA: twin-arginine translocase TatA/TatE family subunit [Blastocatellia bacterium]|nr:twin-arginine translocase TatA/TatE family subunit [Blastocatellia bacterium]
MAGLGMTEILIILLIVILLFGARRIPELAKGLGEGIRNFKTGMHGKDGREIEDHKYRDEAERREESRRSA